MMKHNTLDHKERNGSVKQTLFWLLIVWNVLNVVDIVTTHIALTSSDRFIETNSYTVKSIEKHGIWFTHIFKLLIIAIISVGVYQFAMRMDMKSVYIIGILLVTISNIIYLDAIINNITNLRGVL